MNCSLENPPKLLLVTIAIVFVSGLAAAEASVTLRDGATIRQPDSNVAINVTSTFNVSTQLRTFTDTTQFDTTNWSITGSTGDLIDIHLD